MVEALADHPGVGFLMVRSKAHGAIAVGRRGVRYLDEGRVEGEDPVAPYGGHSVDGLRRVDGMEHCGDLVAISLLDPATDEVAAFEELIGSHGGLGGPQTHPMIMHPSEWQIDEPIVGAEAVYRQIRAWLRNVGIELGPQKPPTLTPAPHARDGDDARAADSGAGARLQPRAIGPGQRFRRPFEPSFDARALGARRRSPSVRRCLERPVGAALGVHQRALEQRVDDVALAAELDHRAAVPGQRPRDVELLGFEQPFRGMRVCRQALLEPRQTQRLAPCLELDLLEVAGEPRLDLLERQPLAIGLDSLIEVESAARARTSGAPRAGSPRAWSGIRAAGRRARSGRA